MAKLKVNARTRSRAVYKLANRRAINAAAREKRHVKRMAAKATKLLAYKARLAKSRRVIQNRAWRRSRAQAISQQA